MDLEAFTSILGLTPLHARGNGGSARDGRGIRIMYYCSGARGRAGRGVGVGGAGIGGGNVRLLQ